MSPPARSRDHRDTETQRFEGSAGETGRPVAPEVQRSLQRPLVGDSLLGALRRGAPATILVKLGTPPFGVALIATPLGLVLALIGALELERVAYAMRIRAAVDLWNYVGAIFASIGYAAALIWIVKRGSLAGMRRRLAAVGQMAFSNYLFHSVIASVLFLGWGFGLAGRFDYAAQLFIVVAIWIVQLIVSPIWLQSFRFGPAEWLWRTLTYGRAQPMRQEAPALAPLAS